MLYYGLKSNYSLLLVFQHLLQYLSCAIERVTITASIINECLKPFSPKISRYSGRETKNKNAF